ncbi:MAG: nucleotidyl transferase AbiEii/AbiGii toxin family protein [Acidimicrobiaceae bacterium]|nr:nucleotidyl transferase AbiEii/AbiGii toxin family protein [Acidimicrobiaceae bacterium]
MAQRREGKGTHKNAEAVGGQYAAGDHTDDPPLSDPPTLARPLTRHDEEAFRDLLEDAATIGGVDMHLVERDYWMCQIASSLLSLESKRYPGSYTSIGGGSLLSLAGITERLSEDVDINVTFVGGADACKPKWGKRLMEECQAQVEEDLAIKGTRDPNGGGNYFRTVRYAYPSVLPQMGEERPAVKSDKGLRDAPREHLMRLNGVPYVGRVAQDQMSTLLPGPRVPMHDDLASRSILGTHPRQVLADKLDAVCWREGVVPTQGDRALDRMVGRIRDHYDIHCLIKWLSDRQMLDADDFLETVERTKKQEGKLRARMRITRPERDRPPGGYATLNAWTPGTQEHSALSEHYPRLRSVVFGELPTYDEVCETIRSAEAAI